MIDIFGKGDVLDRAEEFNDLMLLAGLRVVE